MNELTSYIGVGIGVVALMGGLNVWFITRLVAKVDESSNGVLLLQAEIKHLSEKVSETTALSVRLSQLEKEIVVLKYVARQHHPESIGDEV